MNKESIVQFIGFITKLKLDDFSQTWDYYCKQFNKDPGTNTLERVIEKTNFKYNYISHHRRNNNDFRFSFMKGRESEHFPEQTAKVVQLGGYTQVDLFTKPATSKPEVKLLVFLNHDENDLRYFSLMPFVHLNTYQAYYENCTYGHILEFFLNDGDEVNLMNHLKLKNKIEVAIFKEVSYLSV